MSHDAHESPRPVQEDDALPMRRVVTLLVGLVGLSLACILYASVLLGTRERALEKATRGEIPAQTPAEAGPIPPDRHLMRDKLRFVDVWRAPLQKQLDEWGWVDRERGIVHMPIEKAMELVAREGGR